MDEKTIPKISVVVPVYSEEENIALLHQEISMVCRENNYIYEIILVDDGSYDKTGEICAKLSPVVYIKFRKNFGQTAALDAGIKQAKYEYIVTMDGDRQNDPADIPNLIKYLEENNLDVVSGWRKHRQDSGMKKFVSRGADKLRKFFINDQIHDSGCTLKIYKKICFDNVNLYGEMHRYIPALLAIKGFKIGEIVVNHRPRMAGQTKYNYKRIVKGLIDLISVWFWGKYAVRPLHLLGGIGFLFSFIGTIAAVITVIDYLIGVDLSSTALPIFSAFFLIMGIQLFILGLIADMVMKSYYEKSNANYYNIEIIKEN